MERGGERWREVERDGEVERIVETWRSKDLRYEDIDNHKRSRSNAFHAARTAADKTNEQKGRDEVRDEE